MTKGITLILCFIFAGSAFALRLLPHPWNFTPLGALALSAGFWLPRRYLGLPIAVRFFSDLVLGFFTWQIMVVVYGCYLFSTALGFYLKRYYSWPAILLGGITGALVFFFATNAAVWAWGGLYPASAAGLLASLYAGIPFFRYGLLGDLFYIVIFFGIYEGMAFLLKYKTSASLFLNSAKKPQNHV